MNIEEEFIVGIDYGLKRTGLSVCRKGTTFALPGETILTKKDDISTVKEILSAYPEGIDRFVLGLPVFLDGKESSMTLKVKTFGKILKEYTKKPVHFVDERLTSEHSEEILKEIGLSRKERIPYKDAMAAQLILKDFLSTH